MCLLPSYSFSRQSMQIVDRKLAWSSRPRIDHVNDEYLEYKQRERATREQSIHTRAQVEKRRDPPETMPPLSRVSPKNDDDDERRNLNSIIRMPTSSSTKSDRKPFNYPYGAFHQEERFSSLFCYSQLKITNFNGRKKLVSINITMITSNESDRNDLSHW